MWMQHPLHRACFGLRCPQSSAGRGGDGGMSGVGMPGWGVTVSQGAPWLWGISPGCCQGESQGLQFPTQVPRAWGRGTSWAPWLHCPAASVPPVKAGAWCPALRCHEAEPAPPPPLVLAPVTAALLHPRSSRISVASSCHCQGRAVCIAALVRRAEHKGWAVEGKGPGRCPQGASPS